MAWTISPLPSNAVILDFDKDGDLGHDLCLIQVDQLVSMSLRLGQREETRIPEGGNNSIEIDGDHFTDVQ